MVYICPSESLMLWWRRRTTELKICDSVRPKTKKLMLSNLYTLANDVPTFSYLNICIFWFWKGNLKVYSSSCEGGGGGADVISLSATVHA